MISQYSMLINYAFTEKLRLRKLHKLYLIIFSTIVLHVEKGAISYFELCIAIYETGMNFSLKSFM